MTSAALRQAKLAKLLEIEGYDSVEELIDAVFSDSVRPPPPSAMATKPSPNRLERSQNGDVRFSGRSENVPDF
jgi:hypothetical protein